MVGEIFSVQAYQHLLTVVSSMITRKLNPRVYDSLLVLLDAVRWYRVYRIAQLCGGGKYWRIDSHSPMFLPTDIFPYPNIFNRRLLLQLHT